MNGTLPALLVAAAFGIAVAYAPLASRWIGMLAFVVAATLIAFVPIPAGWSERVHLGCWIAIVTCCIRIHFPGAIGTRGAVVLAIAAGAVGGSVDSLQNMRTGVALLALIATATCFASRAAASCMPLAPRILSSWLIAVALLAATLQSLPVTPGYLPDHLE
ncbi:MAG: hypothetical protein ABW186_10310 [Rhodanobacteraceae bacterium]